MNRDQFVALGCLTIGAFILIGSVRLGLGNFRAPQAGLFPFLIGLLMTILAIILYLGAKPGPQPKILEERWRNLLILLGSVFLYSLSLDWLGFLITTFLFMTILLKAIEPQKWSVALAIAILSTFSTHFLFSIVLKLEFPKGIVGF